MSGPAATSFSPGPNTKLGAMKKKCGGFNPWALRYLILDKPNRTLYYYHSPKDANPRKVLDLNTCTISRLTAEESPKDPGFKVTQPGVRDFVFVGSNAAIVDDWVNAIFQAKAPSGGAGAAKGNASSNQHAQDQQPQSPAASENFSYNGPTLAVLPNRNSTSEPQIAASPASVQPPKNPAPAGNTAAAKSPQAPSARSTQTNNSDQGNDTLVGSGNDANSTLVANNGGGANKPAPGTPVPVLILTPDNKKFPPIERMVTGIIKIGRYVGSQPQSDDMITFKSKVISRNHAEIWAVNGDVYIRDTRSQSGTFLNAMRLSEPSKESKPYRLKPGDVIQFGVDYKGATEDNARCVSIRVDLKTKVIEGTAGGPRGEDATLVGGAGPERTLVGNNPESTLVGAKAGGPPLAGPGNMRPPPGAAPNNFRPPMQQQARPPMQQQPRPMGAGPMGPPGGAPGSPAGMHMQRPPPAGPPGGLVRPPVGMRPPMGSPGMSR